MDHIHATAVSIDGYGVLITGPSGAGKSDLALRLIDRGARLVADDRVVTRVNSGAVSLSAPANLAGLLEVHGIGIVKLDHQAVALLNLVVELVGRDAVERLPEDPATEILGHQIACVRLHAFDTAVAEKVELAVKTASGAANRLEEGALLAPLKARP